MKTIILKSTLLLALTSLLFASCKKTTEALTPFKTTEVDQPENTGMLSFNIPSAIEAPSNSTVDNTETVTDQVPYEGITYSVTIICKTDDQNKIISVELSQDFADATGINDIDFLVNNETTFTEYFNGDYPEVDRPNGWLARFFLGKIVKTPCALGRQIVYRDPWYGSMYEVSGENGDPC